MLNSDQVEYYHANGYLSLEGVLSELETKDLRHTTDEFIEKSREAINHTDVFDLEPGHSFENPRLRRIKRPTAHHPVYHQTLHHEGILNIVSDLIGPGIRTNGDKLNIKYAEFGSPVEWHQDWAFYPHTNDDLLAVGVAIDDMTLKNGCLMAIPGSHKGRIYNHHQEGTFVGAVTESNFTDKDAVPIQVKAGGISIHHVRTLHGSSPNRSQISRRLLLLQYCAIDAWPLLPGHFEDWDTFNSEIIRGEPTNQPRLTEIPVRMPRPPAIHKGSIYENQTILKKKILDEKVR